MIGRVRTFRAAVAAALAAAFAGAGGVAHAVETAEVEYLDGVTGYLAVPSGSGARPAVLLIHEWWGLNDDIREKAEEFAAAGYVALAVDMYRGRSTTEASEARELAGGVRKDMPGAFRNLEAGFDLLRGHGRVDPGRLASVGWCFGGGWSYQIAKNNLGARASVIYYGRFNPEDDLAQMRAVILGHFGETDRAIKADDVRVFQARLRTLSGDHEIFIYPNAGHAFANPRNKGAYDPEAAKAAWDRTLAFLERHL